MDPLAFGPFEWTIRSSKGIGVSVSWDSPFRSDHDPRVLCLRPALGLLLSGEPAAPAPSVAHPAFSLSLFKKLIIILKIVIKDHVILLMYF